MNTQRYTKSCLHQAVARLALVVLAPLVSVVHGNTVYSDGDFSGGNWSFQTSTSLGAGAFASRISTGGNPGAYIQINLSMSAGDGYSLIWGFNSAAVYDPSTLAISTVGYREDLLQGGSPHVSGSALLQNGLRYYRYLWTTDASTWTTRSAATDVGPSGYLLDHNQNNGSNPLNPDFSAVGEPITFGFYRSIGGTAMTDFSAYSGLDNWTTTVNVVPEPSATHLLIAAGLAFFALSFVRWRKPILATAERRCSTS